MPGTVRKIIERIKEQRSGGNSVVAMTVETRLVLQGFDPERFGHDAPDDAARLSRISEIAQEMGVDIGDILQQADVAPDATATPTPAPGSPATSVGTPRGDAAAAAQAVAEAAGIGSSFDASPGQPAPDSTHPLQRFKLFAEEALTELGDTHPGSQSGASFALLIKSSLLMSLYSITTDRVFCDQLQFHGLYQWFLDVEPGTDYAADAFGGDRQEVLGREEARQFFDFVVPRAGRERLFSSDLLQANGRQIKGWMTATEVG
ncbi:MAG: transposase [Halofilum sp. (in: g-proteobacteria)]